MDATGLSRSESDLNMSESASNPSEQEDAPDKALSDFTIGVVWSTFRAIEHEVVRSTEVCSMCNDSISQQRLLLDGESKEPLNLRVFLYRRLSPLEFLLVLPLLVPCSCTHFCPGSFHTMC